MAFPKRFHIDGPKRQRGRIHVYSQAPCQDER